MENSKEIKNIVSIKEKNSIRNSNIELLRIVSMTFIVLFHLAIYTNLKEDNFVLYSIFLPIGQLGNDIFVLISGYYLINKKFSIKRLLKLWFEVFFYSVSIVCVLKIFIPRVEIAVEDFLPIITTKYGFITSYFIMYLLSPFMNSTIKKASKKGLNNFFIITILISCLCSFTRINNIFYGISKFIIFYFIGSYIQLYGIKFLENNSNVKIFLYMVITALAYFILYVLSLKKLLYQVFIFDTSEMSIGTFIFSILIFYLFKNIKIKNNFILNWIAKCSVAVYLIHEHYLLRFIFWQGMYPNIGKEQTLINIIFVVISIWLIAIICEIIRKAIEKVIFNKKTNNLINKIDLKLAKYFITD